MHENLREVIDGIVNSEEKGGRAVDIPQFITAKDISEAYEVF